MIERTSRTMARDRRRLAKLRNLSSWQEAARRHAHEMRTPLAAARLELDRLRTPGEGSKPASADWLRAVDGVAEELRQLGEFTSRFAGFAKLREPALEACDLSEFVGRFTASFATAWPNLELVFDQPTAAPVAMDREMIRQVLVNLCDNSSLALGESSGRTSFRLACDDHLVTLEVADDGPGVDPALREQLFQPYATTRGVGEGMGLGLAISQKILLDHGGDLELAASSACGATFRLTLPRLEDAA
jgi:signal transduction histidine kinase